MLQSQLLLKHKILKVNDFAHCLAVAIATSVRLAPKVVTSPCETELSPIVDEEDGQETGCFERSILFHCLRERKDIEVNVQEVQYGAIH